MKFARTATAIQKKTEASFKVQAMNTLDKNNDFKTAKRLKNEIVKILDDYLTADEKTKSWEITGRERASEAQESLNLSISLL